MVDTFILGKPELNIDGPEKIAGRAKYAIDMSLPGMLHAKVLRSPLPHAKILSIDTSRAKALPGVLVVITGRDLPVLEDFPGDRPTLAVERVCYIGDAVAALAAESLDLAEQALRLIDVQYEELPSVFDPEVAMREDTPVIIHPSGKGPDGKVMAPNTCHWYGAEDGDLEAGFARADLIVENRFTTGMAQCAPMEPHVALADVDIDDNCTIYCNTQTPYLVKTRVAEILKVPSHKIKVIVPPHIGGGFGCKTRMKGEGIASALSRLARKPVKLIYSREEVFADTTVKHPFVIYIKDGVTKDGTLVARKIYSILDAGAYTDGTVGGLVTRNAAYGAVGVYKVPNFKLDNFRVYTNKPVGGAFRGFGVAQTTWAVESQMDIIADQLGMDPLQFRLKNLLKDGDYNPEQYLMDAVGSYATVMKAAELIEWDKPAGPPSGPNMARAKGIAIGCKHFGIQASSAAVKVHEDGSFEVRSSVTDIGQGSRTVMAQIVAEEFKVPMSRVRVIRVDTDITPLDTGQSGSSTTVKAGHAVRLACKETKRQLFERAASLLEASAADLDTAGGKIFVKGSPARAVALEDLFRKLPMGAPSYEYGPFLENSSELVGGAMFYPSNERGPKGEALPKIGFSYCSQAVDLEVDLETGRIKILKLVSILDPGKPINSALTDGQIEGGVGFGIGTGIFEEMSFHNGKPTNPNLTDYRIPTALDVPNVDQLVFGQVETDFRYGPYGAKGIGEVVVCATSAAIANAIKNATGARVKAMPLTQERVALAIGDLAAGG